MAMIETNADQEFANTMEHLTNKVHALESKIGTLCEVNDELRAQNRNLVNTLTETNELLYKLIHKMG